MPIGRVDKASANANIDRDAAAYRASSVGSAPTASPGGKGSQNYTRAHAPVATETRAGERGGEKRGAGNRSVWLVALCLGAASVLTALAIVLVLPKMKVPSAESDTNAQAVAGMDSDSKSTPEPEMKPDSEPESDADSDSMPESEQELDPGPEPSSESDPETMSEPDPGSNPEPEPEPDTEPSETATLAVSFPRVWSGSFDGVNGAGKTEQQDMEVSFLLVEESGYVEAVCTVRPHQPSANDGGGSYAVTGIVNWERGEVELWWSSWIEQGTLGTKRHFTGSFNSSFDTIVGSTETVGGHSAATWKMQAE